MSENKGEKAAIGCLIGCWQLFVTLPMWLLLLFSLLTACGDSIPTWTWVLYWCYVPASLLGAILVAVAKQLFNE